MGVYGHADPIGSAAHHPQRGQQSPRVIRMAMTEQDGAGRGEVLAIKGRVVQQGLAACYTALGREQEARKAVAEVLRLNPEFSLELYSMTVPFKEQSDLEHHIEGLRRAGFS